MPRVAPLILAVFIVAGLFAIAGCDSGGGTTEPPSVPTGLSGEQDGVAVDLTWQSALNADSYNVYRATGDTDVNASSGTQVNTDGPVTGTSFTDASVEAGTVYSFSVTAVGADDRESNASASITLRVFAEPPTRP
jgi:poly(3-hydroxybutyrate) depolymerase